MGNNHSPQFQAKLLEVGAVTRVFTKACKIYGIEDLWWHDLRHEAATRLAEQGLTIPQIQQYTLHDSWSSLERYVNLDLIRKNVLEFDDALEHFQENLNA